MSTSPLSLADFTDNHYLRPRKAQNYGFDFNAGEESDNDPEQLALDDHEQSAAPHEANRSFSQLASRSEQEDDDDEASAYAPSEHNSAPSTPMAQQGPYFDPSQFDFNPEESLRDGRFSTGREIEMTAADDEEEDDYQASKRSSAGPVRKKGASKGRKKGANHVKRPPNAFILYRSYACANNLIPAELRINDHRQISRIVATMWKALPADQRAVWETKAKEAKDKHNEEHPDYRYKPSAKASQRKPRPRKPAIPDEDLTEEQLRERRRCEVVAKVILEKGTPGPAPQEGSASSSSAQPGEGSSKEGSAPPPPSDVKARLAREMKRAVEEDKARREHEEEQRRLGLLPPRPTEPVKARRQRAATVAPARVASPEVLPSPMRAASMDPACLADAADQRSLFQEQGYDTGLGGVAIDADGERIYTCEPVSGYSHHHQHADTMAYSAAEAQWDVRRPSVIYQDPDYSFGTGDYIDQSGFLHPGQAGEEGYSELAMYRSPTHMMEHAMQAAQQSHGQSQYWSPLQDRFRLPRHPSQVFDLATY